MDRQEWDGEGLPPVGCECEYRHKAKNNAGWNICRVIGRFGEWIWIQVPERIPHSIKASTFKFRPIRTAEDEAVEEMVSDTFVRGHGPLLWGRERIAKMLYRAGWRKTER